MGKGMFGSMFFRSPLTRAKGYIEGAAKQVMREKWADVKSVSTRVAEKMALN
jgi:hypothetical protein